MRKTATRELDNEIHYFMPRTCKSTIWEGGSCAPLYCRLSFASCTALFGFLVFIEEGQAEFGFYVCSFLQLILLFIIVHIGNYRLDDVICSEEALSNQLIAREEERKRKEKFHPNLSK